MPIMNTIISGGAKPTGTKNITTNGIHDVTDYASADVNVPTTAPAYYLPLELTSGGLLQHNRTAPFSMNTSGITQISSYVFYSAFVNNTSVTSVSFPDLIQTSDYCFNSTFYNASNLTGDISFPALKYPFGNYAFRGCFWKTKITSMSLDEITTVQDQNVFDIFCEYCSMMTSVSMKKLTTISGSRAFSAAFRYCDILTSVNLSSLTTISGNYACSEMFYNSIKSGAVTIDLSSLTTISGTGACQRMFSDCPGIVSINVSSLTTLSNTQALGGAFGFCSGLTSVIFNSLSAISSPEVLMGTFQSCTNLTSLSFPALKSTSFGTRTNQFHNMLQGVTGCTVHFPSNLQSVIGSWADVTAGFGGTNTTVLYDLPATA